MLFDYEQIKIISEGAVAANRCVYVEAKQKSIKRTPHPSNQHILYGSNWSIILERLLLFLLRTFGLRYFGI